MSIFATAGAVNDGGNSCLSHIFIKFSQTRFSLVTVFQVVQEYVLVYLALKGQNNLVEVKLSTEPLNLLRGRG